MSIERVRGLAAIGGMALVLLFAALISLLNERTVRFELSHLLLTLLVGVAIYLGWPRHDRDRQP